jgi:predicted nucleotidyltransferase component of viral defense system
VTVDVVKNMGASVRQRLLNHAKAKGRPFAEVLQYYAMERFLYRLSVSPHVENFTLKGALLLTAWQAPISRPTMDIDLLGRTDNAVDTTVKVMREISQLVVADDGISFDLASFTGEVIREDADYAGVRTVFVGRVDRARVHMQIDIGFGDVMTPGPETLTYPTLLDFPAPVLSGYSRETVIAEKLQALVQLRMLNTRMKDYFDLWLLTRQPELNKEVLGTAIKRTFENRGVEIDPAPIGLSPAFGDDPAKQMQWIAFLKRSRLTDVPQSLSEVVYELQQFFATLPA